MIRTFTELSKLKTFEERFQYLSLNGHVGSQTFGDERWLNQVLYTSYKWRKVRRSIIIRDNGCDLGHPDRIIGGVIYIHHMNPLTIEQVENDDPVIYDPEFLICASKNTHLAVHYGDESLLIPALIERRPGDTCPWRKSK